MRELQNAQSEDFMVPSVACYTFLLEGSTHPRQTHKVTASGKLVPLANPGPAEDDLGDAAAAPPNLELLNNPAVRQAMGIIQQGMNTGQRIVASNEMVGQDVRNGMGVAMGVLSVATGMSPQQLLARGGVTNTTGGLPALPPIGENQSLLLPAAVAAAPAAGFVPVSTPSSTKKAGNSKSTLKKKATPKKKAPTPTKKSTPKKNAPTPKKAAAKKATSTPKKATSTPKKAPSTPQKTTNPQTPQTGTRRSSRIHKMNDIDE